jgi:hypothetical protein
MLRDRNFGKSGRVILARKVSRDSSEKGNPGESILHKAVRMAIVHRRSDGKAEGSRNRSVVKSHDIRGEAGRFDEHGETGGGRFGDNQQSALGGKPLVPTVLYRRTYYQLAVGTEKLERPHTRHSLQLLYGRSGRPSCTKTASGLRRRQPLQRRRLESCVVEATRFRDGR